MPDCSIVIQPADEITLTTLKIKSQMPKAKRQTPILDFTGVNLI